MRAGEENSGDTYSRACGTTIGSGSLTTVFGMGTGVTFQIWSPENVVVIGVRSRQHVQALPEGKLARKQSIRVVKHSSVSTG